MYFFFSIHKFIESYARIIIKKKKNLVFFYFVAAYFIGNSRCRSSNGGRWSLVTLSTIFSFLLIHTARSNTNETQNKKIEKKWKEKKNWWIGNLLIVTTAKWTTTTTITIIITTTRKMNKLVCTHEFKMQMYFFFFMNFYARTRRTTILNRKITQTHRLSIADSCTGRGHLFVCITIFNLLRVRCVHNTKWFFFLFRFCFNNNTLTDGLDEKKNIFFLFFVYCSNDKQFTVFDFEFLTFQMGFWFDEPKHRSLIFFSPKNLNGLHTLHIPKCHKIQFQWKRLFNFFSACKCYTRTPNQIFQRVYFYFVFFFSSQFFFIKFLRNDAQTPMVFGCKYANK